jgi:hypothetical protein
VGSVENSAGNLKLRFPGAATAELQPAIDTLRSSKTEAVALMSIPDQVELARASALLNRTGCRLMELDGRVTIGIWADLDGPEIRAAVRAFGNPPVKYLDGVGIPHRYKVRDIPPMSTRAAETADSE